MAIIESERGREISTLKVELDDIDALIDEVTDDMSDEDVRSIAVEAQSRIRLARAQIEVIERARRADPRPTMAA